MIRQGTPGSIINMSSVNAMLAIPDQLAYTVSKGGVNQLTRAMSIALAPHDIRVNAIGPGSIQTDVLKAVMNGRGKAQGNPGAHADRSHRRTGRSGRRRRFPGQRSRVLHNGADDLPGRWPVGSELHGSRAGKRVARRSECSTRRRSGSTHRTNESGAVVGPGLRARVSRANPFFRSSKPNGRTAYWRLPW